VWNAVVGSDCEVGLGAIVRDCVVGEETRIGAACSVTDGAVIGRGCRLIARVRVGDGDRVEPDQVLSGATPDRSGAEEFARPVRPRRARMPIQGAGELLLPAGG
jgi:carbonic anhydrase/acetyltransferase-like protein (isoleucine patch superfamily)